MTGCSILSDGQWGGGDMRKSLCLPHFIIITVEVMKEASINFHTFP